MMFFMSSTTGAGNLLKYTRLSKVLAAFTSPKCYSKNNDKPSLAESSRAVEKSGQPHPLYKRDLINFPRIQRLERNPPVRFGFVPKAWFDFFYDKTGVTGGYMLLFGGLVTLFSKEIIVIDEEGIQALAYIGLMVLIHKLYGQTIYNYVVKLQEKEEELLDECQENEKKSVRDGIKELEKKLWCNEGIATFLPKAKLENVYLQMEIVFRERLNAQYMAVKNVLDFQVEKSKIEHLAFQKGLFSWITNNVIQSITPEIRQNALRKSIEDLKDLASRNEI